MKFNLIHLFAFYLISLVSSYHVKVHGSKKTIQKNNHLLNIYPVMPKFIVYCAENDSVWNLFSMTIFQIFDQDQDYTISPSEWIGSYTIFKIFLETMQGITGSDSVGDLSLVVYYGIVAGTLEWRLEIELGDWFEFMNLLREYLYKNIQVNGNGGVNNTNSTTGLQLIKRNIVQTSLKGFITKMKVDGSTKMRHQALGNYLCGNIQQWGIIVTFSFKLFDLNQDGYIQQSEFNLVSDRCGIDSSIKSYWTYMDTNSDGQLDIAEWTETMDYAKLIIEPQLNKLIPNIDFGQLMGYIF